MGCFIDVFGLKCAWISLVDLYSDVHSQLGVGLVLVQWNI